MKRLKWRRAVFLLFVLVSGLLAVGCSSDNGDVDFSGFPGPGQQQSQSARTLTPEDTAKVALLQESLGRVVGGLLATARYAAPDVTNFRVEEILLRSIVVEEEEDLGSNQDKFRIKRTPLGNGRFRIQIFERRTRELVATAIALPSVPKPGGGFVQELSLGPEVFTERSPLTSARGISPFFGYEGRANLHFDSLGVLQSVELIDLEFFGGDLSNISTVVSGERFQNVSGTLTRNSDATMTGEIQLGGRGRTSIQALVDRNASYSGLTLASELFGGQGQMLLNNNFDSAGVFSPPQDPRNSSPLVVVPLGALGSPAAPNSPPPSPRALLSSGGSVGYVVEDNIFTVALPNGKTQSVSLLDRRPLDALGGAQILPPPGSRLVLFASDPILSVGATTSVFVYALGPNNQAVPFTTNRFQLSTPTTGVVELLSTSTVRGKTPGTARLTYLDQNSGLSAETDITVISGSGPATSGRGFVYVPDFTGQRIVRYQFDAANPGVPANRTNFDTGHQALEIEISSDQQVLFAENTDSTYQVFSINPADGNLTLRATDNKNLRSIVQSLIDPAVYYATETVSGVNRIRKYRLNSTSFQLVQEGPEYQIGASGKMVIAAVGGKEFLYTGAVVAGTPRVTALDTENGAIFIQQFTTGVVVELGVARPDGTNPTLEVLLQPTTTGSNGVLVTFPIGLNGALTPSPAPTQVQVNPQQRTLWVHGNDRAYTGSFSVASINGVDVNAPPTAPTLLPGQPYASSGPANALFSIGNLLFATTSPDAKLDTFTIGADGALTPVGTVDVGGNINDVEAVVFQ